MSPRVHAYTIIGVATAPVVVLAVVGYAIVSQIISILEESFE